MSGNSKTAESGVLQAAIAAYTGALTRVDYQAALDALEQALAHGVQWPRLVSEVIAPAQEQVGDHWMSGVLGVADEHAATTVAENVLAVMSPLPSPSSGTSRVIMVCVEGEWHTFPLRLAAAVASHSSGINLTVLGGSISGEHLRQFIRNAHPAAVALSTTLSAHLIGAARSIRAACEEGVPVVVGGAAWGEGQRRARHLGANLHLTDASQLAAAVASLDGPRPVEDLPTVPEEALLLDDPPDDLLRLALKRHAGNDGRLREMSSGQEAQMLADLSWIARHAANAVACDDPSIVREVLDWLPRLRTPRGVPEAGVLESARYLAETVEPVAPQAARILRQETADARQRVEHPRDGVGPA